MNFSLHFFRIFENINNEYSMKYYIMNIMNILIVLYLKTLFLTDETQFKIRLE